MEQQKKLREKFNLKEINAKVTCCYKTIFFAAEVVNSPKLSLNAIILTFSHSEHQ